MVGEVCGGAAYVSAAHEPNGQLGEYKKKWEVVLVTNSTTPLHRAQTTPTISLYYSKKLVTSILLNKGKFLFR
jgi:hypothetical protein